MKTVKSLRGPFQKRPHYELHEIEQICTDELRSVDLLPKEPTPIRIDRFIEKRWPGIVPEYQALPDGILGFSRFGSKGLESVVIAAAFDQESSQNSERRLRSTLAHEAGHALLQGHLFALGAKPTSLFDDGISEPKILCRDEKSSNNRYNGEWWEFQANRAIGSLLLPHVLVEKAISHLLSGNGIFGVKTLDASQRQAAATLLASTFNVNPAAAELRINLLYPLSKGQLTL